MITIEQWNRLKPGSVLKYTPEEGAYPVSDGYYQLVYILYKTTYQLRDLMLDFDPDFNDPEDRFQFDWSKNYRDNFAWYRRNHTVIVE